MLAVGLTENNANLLWSPQGKPTLPPGFDHARAELDRMNPRYLRLVVDWSAAQPGAGQQPNWQIPANGCLRDLGPCAGFGGVREQLRAIASRQQGRDLPNVLIVLSRTPTWAASPPSGCERPNTLPTARAPRDDALSAYRDTIVSLAAEAERDGARVKYWSPWNEPNHPTQLSPQREGCARTSRALAPAAYAKLATAMQQALDDAPGDQRMVLGELAAFRKPRRMGAGVGEFIDALPKDVACAGSIWGQHSYVGGEAVIDRLELAIDAKGCSTPGRIWITEAGVGAAHAGSTRRHDPAALRLGCRQLHEQLLEWDRDPRVDVAFQYSFREDNLFPVGLVSTDLATDFPALAEWQAWGAKRKPDGPAPELPRACR